MIILKNFENCGAFSEIKFWNNWVTVTFSYISSCFVFQNIVLKPSLVNILKSFSFQKLLCIHVHPIAVHQLISIYIDWRSQAITYQDNICDQEWENGAYVQKRTSAFFHFSHLCKITNSVSITWSTAANLYEIYNSRWESSGKYSMRQSWVVYLSWDSHQELYTFIQMKW